MKIVAIATQKGGAGKTTLATNLAVAQARDGLLTLLIDADGRQKTALEWFRKRSNQENPIVIEAPDRESLMRLFDLASEKDIDRVIVDTPGVDSLLVNNAIAHANFVLMPCGPSGFDVSAQRITAAIVERLGKEAAFVITKALPRGKESQETRNVLSGLGFDSSDCQTTNLKDFRDAAVCGQSVLEYAPKGKAAREIRCLYEWLESKLEGRRLLDEFKREI